MLSPVVLTPFDRARTMSRRIPIRRWTPAWRPSPDCGPLLFRDAGRHLLPGWSLEWLLQAFGQARVPVRTGAATAAMSLARAVGLAARSRRSAKIGFDLDLPYVTDWDFSAAPGIARRFRRPDFARRDPLLEIPRSRRPRLVWLYFGGSRSGTPLHCDVLGAHAWSLVVSGSKDWAFYPPGTDFGDNPIGTNVFAPGGRREDERAGRVRWTARVGPGDLIFVPSKWWHQVRNREPTLAMGGNFISPDIAPLVLRECDKMDYRHISHQLLQSYGDRLSELRDAA